MTPDVAVRSDSAARPQSGWSPSGLTPFLLGPTGPLWLGFVVGAALIGAMRRH